MSQYNYFNFILAIESILSSSTLVFHLNWEMWQGAFARDWIEVLWINLIKPYSRDQFVIVSAIFYSDYQLTSVNTLKAGTRCIHLCQLHSSLDS